MLCRICGHDYAKWYDGPIENHLCPICNAKEWEAFEREHQDDLQKIKEIEAQGHPRHCAIRQVWGDGECECDLYEVGYDPYAWMKDVQRRTIGHDTPVHRDCIEYP